MPSPLDAPQLLQALNDDALAWPGLSVSAEFRRHLEDFQVDEVLGFDPDGDGEHTLLRVEKRDTNTEWLARQLARAAGVKTADVGFCGLKDRRAVTRQWFSLPPGAELDADAVTALGEAARILERHPHRRKLRRGSHAGNRFLIRLRDFNGERDAVADRLARIAEQGFPNYFGPQRFGIDGNNLPSAVAFLLGGGRMKDRHKRGLLLSAARSFLFNRVLSLRVAQGSWNQALDGDWLNLAGSRSRFRADLGDSDLAQRIIDKDLHVTGPLWGRGRDQDGPAEQREAEWLADYAPLLPALERQGLDAERRPLRALAEGLSHEFDGHDLVLSFTLASGAFATSLLRELVGDQALRRNA